MGYPRMPQIDADGDGKLVFADDWPKAGKRVRIGPILEESDRVAKGRFANEGGEYAPVWHPSGMPVWCGLLPAVSSRCSSTPGYILGTLRVRGRGGGFSPRGNVSGAFSVASRS